MGSGDGDVVDRDAGVVARSFAGGAEISRVTPTKSQNTKASGFFSLAEDDRAGKERIFCAGTESLVEIAAHAERCRRRDFYECDAGFERFGGAYAK